MKYSEEDLKDFEKTMRPAVEWLQKHGCPYDKVIIQQDRVELVRGEMAFPVKAPD